VENLLNQALLLCTGTSIVILVS